MSKHEIIAKNPIVYDLTAWHDVSEQDKVANSILVLPQSYKKNRHVSDFGWEVLFYDGDESKYMGLFWEKEHAIWFANKLIKKFVEGYTL